MLASKAREWVGTPFLHQGRIKKTEYLLGGCDCAGLLIGSAKEIGVIIPDYINYTKIPRGNLLEQKLEQYLIKKERLNFEENDIALFEISKNLQHIGIISKFNNESYGLIHSHISAGKVVEHILTDDWQKKLKALFTIN